MDVAQLILGYVQALAWPGVVVFSVVIFRDELRSVLRRMVKAELPGGVAVDFSQEIREATQVSKEVAQQRSKKQESTESEVPKRPSIPLTEANARMISLGLRPTPSGLDLGYYRRLAEQDPNIALAGLRMEIEILARNLAKGFRISVGDRDAANILIRKLKDGEAITEEQHQLLQAILRLCNAAIHGRTTTQQEANSVIDLTLVLSKQYLEWLSWGFDDGWKAKETEA